MTTAPLPWGFRRPPDELTTLVHELDDAA
jgi:hypothetical protein